MSTLEAIPVNCTYHIDELDHGETKFDVDFLGEVPDGADERVVALAVKQVLH